MKLVFQRVEGAAVKVVETGEEIARIGKGLLCLVGIGKKDHRVDLDYGVKKCLGTRLWADAADKPWQKSVVDMDYEVLVVSNFTLQAQTKKGFQPDFSAALSPNEARPLYDLFVDTLKKKYKPEKIQTGQFQTRMRIEIYNDGPVTLTIDTQTLQLNRGPSSSSSSALPEDKQTNKNKNQDPTNNPASTSSSTTEANGEN